MSTARPPVRALSLAAALACAAACTVPPAPGRARTNDDERVPVAFAVRDLNPGVPLTPEDLQVAWYPRRFLTAYRDPITGALQHPRLFATVEELIGRVPHQRILVNEVIRPERLADRDQGIGANALLPHGQRALALALGHGDTVSDVVLPGALVNLRVTYHDRSGQQHDERIGEAVRVLGVRGDLIPSQPPSANVLLLVTPRQAEDLAFATTFGSIDLRVVRRRRDASREP